VRIVSVATGEHHGLDVPTYGGVGPSPREPEGGNLLTTRQVQLGAEASSTDGDG